MLLLRLRLRLLRSCRKVRMRLCAAALVFSLVLGLLLLFLLEPFTSSQQKEKEQPPPTLVLVWTHPFQQRQDLPDCRELFGISGCALTDDRRAYAHADAVVIHHQDVARGSDVLPEPQGRPSAQKWIWMNYESPSHTPRLRELEGLFNLTLSYRSDSDIFLPYGYLVPRARATRIGRAHLLHRPSKKDLRRPHLLAWVISNWSESHARVAFYYQLRRYVSVDVFGDAGRPMEDDSRAGVVRLLGGYQFYLALENSLHTDYITEKLWNAVQAGAVPVVLGPDRKNYERFLPPEAFIHVDDFPTVQGLAQYLLTLRENPLLLRKHLDWRGDYAMYRPIWGSEHYCWACKTVRRDRGKTQVVRNVTEWFCS